MKKLNYDRLFYERQRANNFSSAEIIVPKVMSLLNEVCEDGRISVIDLGCGSGNWLSVFKKLGGWM